MSSRWILRTEVDPPIHELTPVGHSCKIFDIPNGYNQKPIIIIWLWWRGKPPNYAPELSRLEFTVKYMLDQIGSQHGTQHLTLTTHVGLKKIRWSPRLKPVLYESLTPPKFLENNLWPPQYFQKKKFDPPRKSRKKSMTPPKSNQPPQLLINDRSKAPMNNLPHRNKNL